MGRSTDVAQTKSRKKLLLVIPVLVIALAIGFVATRDTVGDFVTEESCEFVVIDGENKLVPRRWGLLECDWNQFDPSELPD